MKIDVVEKKNLIAFISQALDIVEQRIDRGIMYQPDLVALRSMESIKDAAKNCHIEPDQWINATWLLHMFLYFDTRS